MSVSRTKSGGIGDSQIGVLLPETDPDGAMIFSDRVRYVMTEQGEAPRSRIDTYPENASGDDGDGDGQMWLDGMEPGRLSGGDRRAPGLLNSVDALPGTVTVSSSETISGENADPLDHVLRVPLPLWKRAFDVVLSALALVLLSPLMLLVAFLIKRVSPGPVVFRQERVGYLGKRFNCLKFRTMHLDNDASEHRKHFKDLMKAKVPMTKLDQERDPRIIPAGRLLRQTAIDELLQLYNVLQGDMSLVGPRPCIPYEYTAYQTWQRQRVDAVPGMTGLWQVSGKNRLSFEEMMRLDIVYARRMSPWLDVLIILRTPLAVLQQVRDGWQAKRAARASGRSLQYA